MDLQCACAKTCFMGCTVKQCIALSGVQGSQTAVEKGCVFQDIASVQQVGENCQGKWGQTYVPIQHVLLIVASMACAWGTCVYARKAGKAQHAVFQSAHLTAQDMARAPSQRQTLLQSVNAIMAGPCQIVHGQHSS